MWVLVRGKGKSVKEKYQSHSATLIPVATLVWCGAENSAQCPPFRIGTGYPYVFFFFPFYEPVYPRNIFLFEVVTVAVHTPATDGPRGVKFDFMVYL